MQKSFKFKRTLSYFSGVRKGSELFAYSDELIHKTAKSFRENNVFYQRRGLLEKYADGFGAGDGGVGDEGAGVVVAAIHLDAVVIAAGHQ